MLAHNISVLLGDTVAEFHTHRVPNGMREQMNDTLTGSIHP